MQMKVETPDVSHWLINASLKRGSLEADREWLNGDAITIIIAGRYFDQCVNPNDSFPSFSLG